MIRHLPRALAIASLLMLPAIPAEAQQDSVHAVLFYSPTCPHCQAAIEDTLLPMVEHYGDQLEVLAISTATPEGQVLFLAAVERFGIPEERRGVPMLIVGETILVGSAEIPERLPPIVESGLAQGGIDWPDIPGLSDVLVQVPATETEVDSSQPAETDRPAPSPVPRSGVGEIEHDLEPAPISANPGIAGPDSVRVNLLRDPLGSMLSVSVLAGMVISVIAIGASLRSEPRPPAPAWASWGIPLLALAGALIASYLAFVEATGAEAVCGPVGNCNAVQQSRYAMLFGRLPVGVLGVAGYLAIITAWLVGRQRLGTPSDLAGVALFAMTAFGVLLSIYLTFLEPFVIGATCAWCLSSAIIMTVLMWLASSPAMAALNRIRKGAAV